MDERQINSLYLEESPAFLQFVSSDYNSVVDTYDLIISTYQLSKENSKLRNGSIFLVSSKEGLIKHRIETNGGVFRFELIPGNNAIVAALTSGRLSLIDPSKEKQHFSEILSRGMMLNVSWNKSADEVLCCDDYGELMVVDTTSLHVQDRWRAHKSPYGLAVCEVWSCSWLTDSINVCVSGAEDCCLKLWDIREGGRKPQAINDKAHGAGIVFVGSITSGCENELITGSYDENVRLFDLRKMNEPLVEHKLSGGVWHMERMAVNEDEELYLASCMYGGWCIISKSAFSRFKTVHVGRDPCDDESLLYGISSRSLADRRYRVASCTFNDKCVRICEIMTGHH